MRHVLSFVLALISIAGCASRPCSDFRPLSALWFANDDRSDQFSDALVLVGYHNTSIAPAGIAGPNVDDFKPAAFRRAENMCAGSARTLNRLHVGGFYRVSGRGRYLSGGTAFEIECVCKVERVVGNRELGEKMRVIQ